MSDIDTINAISAAQSSSQVSNAIAVKMLKIANEQEQSIATLIDAAVQSGQQIAAGRALDVQV